MNDTERALARLIDDHLNERPSINTGKDKLLRHIRIGDKLLELLIESIEMGDKDILKYKPKLIIEKIATREPEIQKLETKELIIQEAPFPDNSDLDAALDVRKRYKKFMNGRKRGGGPEHEHLWLEAFKLTEGKDGSWSSTMAGKLLDTKSSAGSWLLRERYPSKMKKNIR